MHRILFLLSSSHGTVTGLQASDKVGLESLLVSAARATQLRASLLSYTELKEVSSADPFVRLQACLLAVVVVVLMSIPLGLLSLSLANVAVYTLPGLRIILLRSNAPYMFGEN